jgi:hypothetical protein
MDYWLVDPPFFLPVSHHEAMMMHLKERLQETYTTEVESIDQHWFVLPQINLWIGYFDEHDEEDVITHSSIKHDNIIVIYGNENDTIDHIFRLINEAWSVKPSNYNIIASIESSDEWINVNYY